MGRLFTSARIRYTACNRMNKEAVYAYLASRHIPYEATGHEAVFCMADLPSVPLPYPDADAKNLFVRDDKKERYYLITVKGDKRVDLKAFRRRYGTRALSFACADELRALLGLEPGSVTPLGVLNDTERRVHVFLDAAFVSGTACAHRRASQRQHGDRLAAYQRPDRPDRGTWQCAHACKTVERNLHDRNKGTYTVQSA